MSHSSTSRQKMGPGLGQRLVSGLVWLGYLIAAGAAAAQTGTPASPDPAGEMFRQGYRAVQAGQFVKAQGLLQQTREAYPLLADYSLYYLAEAQFKTGQPARAKHTWLLLLSEHPGSPWRGHAKLALARLAQAEKNWPEALRYADEARKATVESVRHAATLIAAQAQEHTGRPHTAYTLYQRLRRAAALSAAGQTAKTHALRLRHTAALQPKEPAEYIEEMQLLALEADQPALAALSRQFEQRFALTRLSAPQLRAVATLYRSQGRTQEAAAALQTLVERSPSSAGALYRWARLLWNADKDAPALDLFERLANTFPSHRLAAEALYAIGRIHQSDQDETRASRVYRQLAERFPASAAARAGRWHQGWMAYQRGDFGQAEQHFAGLARRLRNTQASSALYWQARSLDKQSKRDRAETLYRRLLQNEAGGYYALWAEKRLGLRPLPLALAVRPEVRRPPLSPRLSAYYQRSQALAQLGLFEFARRELDRLREAAPSGPAFRLFFLHEYHRLDSHHRALRLAQVLPAGERRAYDFPRAYWPSLQTHAGAQRLDPYLVLALIRQESLFDPRAVSAARAYGLMQLLPSTAAKLVQPGAELRLTDPDRNIELGTRYLRQLLNRYNDNLILGLAGYNAGPQAVEKWRTRFPHAEADEFVENISYRETRKYVKKVLGNYRTYRRLYEPAGVVIWLGRQARPAQQRRKIAWHN